MPPPDIRAPHQPSTGISAEVHAAWRYIRTKRQFYGYLIGYATAGAMIAFAYGAWLLAVMSRKFSLPVSEVGIISGPITLVASITGQIACGLILDRVTASGRTPLLHGIIAMVMSTGAATLTTLVPDATEAWVRYALSRLFVGSFYPVGAALLAQHTPLAVMGKITVIYLLFQALIGSGLGPTMVAYLCDHFFQGRQALAHALGLYCMIIGLISLIMASGLTRALRHANPQI